MLLFQLVARQDELDICASALLQISRLRLNSRHYLPQIVIENPSHDLAHLAENHPATTLKKTRSWANTAPCIFGTSLLTDNTRNQGVVSRFEIEEIWTKPLDCDELVTEAFADAKSPLDAIAAHSSGLVAGL
jgi:hypothetical protein